MIQKLKLMAVILTMIAGAVGIFIPVVALADTTTPPKCDSGYDHPLDAKGKQLEGCSKIKTDSECPSGKAYEAPNDITKCVPISTNPVALKDNPIVKDLNDIVNVLSGLVGVVVVGVIILGGIQFATAGDKAEAVSAAKKRITNGVIALVAFLFIFAFLQWLIPGGVFG